MPRIITPAELRSQPWKNGGGVTNEILRWPEVDDYDVRISLADDRVDAAFSRFPGYRRWSVLAGDAPILLAIGDVTHELVALGDHIEVDGDVAISASLPAGPTRLFNVLARNGLAVHVGVDPIAVAVRFAFALAATSVHGIELARWSSIVFDEPTPITASNVAYLT